MPNEPLFRLGAFAPVVLGPGDTCSLDINIMPGLVWRMRCRGPGRILNAEVQTALNEFLRNQGVRSIRDLRGTRVEFTYDCARREISEITMERVDPYIDAANFGYRYDNYLIGREPRRRPPPPGTDAQEKARKTLERMLTDEQRKSLEENNYFYLIGSEGTRYRLTTEGYSGNVYWMDDDDIPRGRYCAHPRTTAIDLDGYEDTLPVLDSVIAQKLALETDEVAFLNVANLFGGGYPPRVKLKGDRNERRTGWPQPLDGCGCDTCINLRARDDALARRR